MDGRTESKIEKILLSAPEAAEALSMCAKTIWTLAEKEGLPTVRIGRRVLFPVEGLKKWVSEREPWRKSADGETNTIA